MEFLIPEAWFVDLHSAVLLLITAFFFVVLIKGADWVVEGASGLAFRVGMPKVIVGATIVSLGTTSPEAAVSVAAAWSGNAGLALGNAVGSIITDTGLIFGLCCMLATLPADRFVLSRQGWIQFSSGCALATVCYAMYVIQGDDAALYRSVGMITLLALVWYLYISVKWARMHREEETLRVSSDAHHSDRIVVSHHEQKHGVPTLIVMVVSGLILVMISSHVVVQSVSQLADRWGVPEVVIAATLIAGGTSLPELMVGITAIRRGHPELLVGNVIGADILNVLFVVGASAVAAPLPLVDANPDSPAPYIFLTLQLPTMVLILSLFRILIVPASRKGNFARWNGIPLFIIYVSFVILSAVLGH